MVSIVVPISMDSGTDAYRKLIEETVDYYSYSYYCVMTI